MITKLGLKGRVKLGSKTVLHLHFQMNQIVRINIKYSGPNSKQLLLFFILTANQSSKSRATSKLKSKPQKLFQIRIDTGQSRKRWLRFSQALSYLGQTTSRERPLVVL
ncbi:hypothetical protein ACOSQ4_031284 [Xanthoceras sorbifolium]